MKKNKSKFKFVLKQDCNSENFSVHFYTGSYFENQFTFQSQKVLN